LSVRGPGEPLRVVEVVASLSLGGAERVALEVAGGLRVRGLHADLLCAGPGAALPPSDYERSVEDEARRRGVTVHRVPSAGLSARAARRRFGAWLEARAYDVVHVHNRPQDWQMAILGRLSGWRVVYSVHLAYEPTWRHGLLYAVSSRAARAVVCVSQAVAAHVRAHEHVPPGRQRVIYNGVDTGLFAPLAPDERAHTRSALGWRDGEFVWLCAARLSPQKGHEHLIAALEALPPSPRRRLVLAGDGPLRADLEARVRRAGLSDGVAFLGARRDVPVLLGAADGYACASLQEGHPLALLEAMAAGLPVVAPRLPVIVETASVDGPVLYGPALPAAARGHDPAALAAAMKDVEERAREHQVRARRLRDEVARRFSLDAMIDAHADLYASLARDGRSV
jgi:glycosyltransferase involved in cell wall biosynthesis